eukprot:2555869-Rhodomonas_salina.2
MSVPDIAQRARATEHKIGVLTCDVARDKVRKPASSQRVFSNRSDPFLERKEDGRCQDAEREGGRQTLADRYPVLWPGAIGIGLYLERVSPVEHVGELASFGLREVERAIPGMEDDCLHDPAHRACFQLEEIEERRRMSGSECVVAVGNCCNGNCCSGVGNATWVLSSAHFSWKGNNFAAGGCTVATPSCCRGLCSWDFALVQEFKPGMMPNVERAGKNEDAADGLAADASSCKTARSTWLDRVRGSKTKTQPHTSLSLRSIRA